jgi:hypothetical protein
MENDALQKPSRLNRLAEFWIAARFHLIAPARKFAPVTDAAGRN